LVIFLTFGIIKGYRVLPLPFYIICIVGMCVMCNTISYALPRMIRFHEVTSRKINEVKKGGNRLSTNDKLLQRKVGSFKPLALSAGVFGSKLFEVRKSMKNNFYECLLNNTVSLLVSVPETYLKVH